jgi:zinc finger SWIM domain-containing protein 3
MKKVGPETRNDNSFWVSLNACLWGLESGDEFETQWNTLINKYGLKGNAWMANRFNIRESWIPAYFMDIPLVRLLRTASRSKSANSFFNRFIHHKLSFVEFWLRLDTTLECQWLEGLKEDHMSVYATPKLITSWPVEKQGSVLYTCNMFKKIQIEVQAARDHYIVVSITQFESVKMVVINDGSMRDRVVRWCTLDIFGCCSCKLFETMEILCDHVILASRGEKLDELPLAYILKRFERRCKRSKQPHTYICIILFHFSTFYLTIFLYILP